MTQISQDTISKLLSNETEASSEALLRENALLRARVLVQDGVIHKIQTELSALKSILHERGNAAQAERLRDYLKDKKVPGSTGEEK